jgi:glycerol-3-phosphate dehydrogenase (NAD(P)+)
MSECDILVVGAGAWGTALAVSWARAGKNVALWCHEAPRAAALAATRENFRLPGVRLPDEVVVTGEFSGAGIVVVCVPTQTLGGILARLPDDGAPLVLCCKGLDETTLRLPAETAAEVASGRQIAVLSGPNFAHEIAAGLPAAAVLATADAGLRAALMQGLRTERLRLYGSADVVGASVGGAAKNVIAIAAGAVMGAGLGEIARAALMTRGVAEMARLAAALGGRAETVFGLSGLGDLLLTCTGAKSRNFSLGLALGRGEALDEVLGHRTNVTEGVATAPALLQRARQVGVEMPLTEAVVGLLAGDKTVAAAMGLLMGRALRDE